MQSLTEQLLDVNGTTLEVYRGGAGHPAICCQHPHSSNLERFKWYAAKTDFIYVVVRGLGNSSPIRETGDLTNIQAAHDLEAVRRKLGIKRWVVQGFSAGSQVALCYALTYPDSLAGLISIASFAKNSSLLGNPKSLCSPSYPAYQDDLEALRGKNFEHLPTALSYPGYYWAAVNPNAWGLFKGETPIAIMPGSQLRDRLKAVFEEVTFFNLEDRLKEIKVPTLVVGGRNDPIVPLEESMPIHQRIPNSRMLVLEHSGHGAEGADEAIFRESVMRFLSEVDR